MLLLAYSVGQFEEWTVRWYVETFKCSLPY